MLIIPIPGRPDLALEHMVLDFNGTLAVDGHLLPGVVERICSLAGSLDIHVVTGDTHGTAKEALSGLPCHLVILAPIQQTEAKAAYLEKLGVERCVAIGNGANDRLLLGRAALGIVVIQREGAACATMATADVAAPDILAALDLLMHPTRLAASLRT